MKDMDFAKLLGEIELPAAEFEGGAQKKPGPLPRIIPFAAALVILAAAGFLLLRGRLFPKPDPKLPAGYEFMAESGVPKGAVLPPSPITSRPAEVSYVSEFDLRSACAEADCICIVTVGDWLEENDFSSYYSASVEKRFKGDPGESIVIVQLGSSKNPNGVSAFYPGDKLLLFLKGWEISGFENSYAVVGADICCLYAAADDAGNVWFLDLKQLMSLKTQELEPDLLPHSSAEAEALKKELCAYYQNREPLCTSIRRCGFIFPAEEMERTMDSIIRN